MQLLSTLSAAITRASGDTYKIKITIRARICGNPLIINFPRLNKTASKRDCKYTEVDLFQFVRSKSFSIHAVNPRLLQKSSSAMSSRTNYSTITPASDIANFTVPPSRAEETLQDSSSYNDASQRKKTQWRRYTTQGLDLIHNNIGLLLVASSELFFSLMNLAVKELNTIEPPVPTLEVCISIRVSYQQYNLLVMVVDVSSLSS